MTATLLHELLDLRAAGDPCACALRRAGRTWTYGELRDLSLTAAGWLASHGVERGDRVLVLDHNDAQTVALVFAASRLGAVYVVVSDRTRPYYLRHIIGNCAPRVVLGAGEVLQRVRSLTAVPVLDSTSLLRTGPAATGDLSGRGVLADDPVSLIYTSGSTALPKAVVSTHRQVLFAVGAIQSRLGYRPDDVVLCCLPLSFDYGLYQAFLACSGGSALVLGADADAGPALLRRVVDEQVTVLPLVPSLALTLCRLVNRAGSPPAGLRMVTNTGDTLTPALAARLRQSIPGLSVVGMFGLTECKRVAIGEPDLDLTRPGSVGRPLPGTEVFVVDPFGQKLPAGEVGELVVRGPHVMAGYWNCPELTADRFRRDYLGRTSLHTGDHCRLDEDGYLYFVGRNDQVYKQNGFRISAVEVEAVAADVPGVELAVALAPDGEHGARLAVTGTITREQLVKELRTRMEEQRLPADCRVLDALPLNTNGKVDRRALRASWASLAEAVAPGVRGVPDGAAP